MKFIRRGISMKKLKIISIFSLIISVILTIGGIGIVTYYVDNLFIRGLSVFVLIMSSFFVSTTVRLIFEESKQYKF
ncbi:putative membrane protein [Clostridioides difficile CD69]|nr:putative membrane protein [Clostridioides difficile CD69]